MTSLPAGATASLQSNRSRDRNLLTVRLAAAWSLRVACTVAAVTLACAGWPGSWQRGSGQSTTLPVRSSAAPSAAHQLAPLTAMLPGDGQWSFAGLEFNLSQADVASAALANHFRSLAAEAEAVDSTAVPLPAASWERLLEKLPAQIATSAGHQIHAFEHHDLRCQIVTRMEQGQACLVSLAAAFPDDRGRWQCFALRPRSAAGRQRRVAHLLPLPAATRRQGARYAGDGRLQMELVSLESAAADLLDSWRAAGWQIQATRWGAAGDFSYLCGRGDEVIYAWSADGSDHLTNLMLVHSGIDVASLADERLSLAQESTP